MKPSQQVVIFLRAPKRKIDAPRRLVVSPRAFSLSLSLSRTFTVSTYTKITLPTLVSSIDASTRTINFPLANAS